MRLPRDIGGKELAKHLAKLHYQIIRQTGSHIRMTRRIESEEHHITIPKHKNLRTGTLNNILKDVAEHLKISRNELISILELK